MKIQLDIRDAVAALSDAEKIQMIRDIDNTIMRVDFSMEVIKTLAEELVEEGVTKTELRKLI